MNVIAFDDEPVAALLRLGDGDSVALAGSLTPKVWTDKEGNTRPSLDMVAHQVLIAYHVTKKRKAMHQDAPAPGQHPKDEAWQARAPQDRSELDSDDAKDW